MEHEQSGLELEALTPSASLYEDAEGDVILGKPDDFGVDAADDEDAKATEQELADAELVAAAIDKPSNPKRWIVLVLATLAIFGPYYVFDNPAGTQQTVSGWDDEPRARARAGRLKATTRATVRRLHAAATRVPRLFPTTPRPCR